MDVNSPHVLHSAPEAGGFVIRASSFIRHSDLLICHFVAPLHQKRHASSVFLERQSSAHDHVEACGLALLLGIGLAVFGVENIVQIQSE